MARYLYSELASVVQAWRNCTATSNTEWIEKHSDRISQLVADHMPSGSGFDCGTRTVTPAFGSFHMRISGRNRNDIKDYIADTFQCALMTGR